MLIYIEVINISKYILKRIYKLAQMKLSYREIKKQLNEKYNIYIKQDDLNKILRKIKKDSKNDKYKNNISKILYLYKHCSNTTKLCEYLNNKYNYQISCQYLVNLAHKNGIKKENIKISSIRKISKEQEQEIIEKYLNGKTTYELAKEYEYKTHKTICDILLNNNVRIRTYSEHCELNKPYNCIDFKEVDNKFKAYYIGLLLTDGYVNKNSIFLDLIDEDAIICISQYFNNQKYTKIIPKDKNHKIKYRLHISGNERVNELKRLGIFNKKTFTCLGPKLTKREEKFLPYIFRGIIDGDGWIRNDGKEFFISSASKDFILWCKENLIKLGFLDIEIKFVENDTKGIYLIRSAKKENIKILKELIYYEEFGMKRKRNRLYKEGRSETIIRSS